MFIESEARLGPIVRITCQKGCFHDGPCLNNLCMCHEEQVGKFSFCCDSCVGSLCLCPPTLEQCNSLCPNAIANMFPFSQSQSPNIINWKMEILWCTCNEDFTN